MSEAPVLRFYDSDKELSIQCDASQTGLGAALLQDGQPLAFVSRALTDTETRYAQLEKEMLAVVWSIDKFDQYTYGRRVNMVSDHKPLESIMKKALASAPKRLQGMMMRLQKYGINLIQLYTNLERTFSWQTLCPERIDQRLMVVTTTLNTSTHCSTWQ